MAFTPNEFISHIKSRGGPAKANRFQTIIPIPSIVGKNIEEPSTFAKFADAVNNPGGFVTGTITDTLNNKSKSEADKLKDSRPQISRFLALQCETTGFPSKSLQVQSAKTYGPVFQIPTAVQYGNFSMTFICTNDFYEKKLFERWIEIIIPQTTNDFRFPRGDSPENSYYSEISVFQYDDFVQQVYGIKLKDAFPTSITDLVLNWSDDNFHKLTVNFAYQKYTSIYEGKFDRDAIISAAVGGLSGFIPNVNNILQF